uniref:Uncharacterized protein n=1 Tax=Ananas comosus var. bracteatus TaxID=296719 RepID=A0A6V7PXC0_ANACO|nr:unnamed protein product [Ananas comosus var. bracteatus]
MAVVAEAKQRKPSKRMLKIFKKRAQNYHSDSDDDDEEEVVEKGRKGEVSPNDADNEVGSMDFEKGGSKGDEEGDGEGGHRGGILRFDEGCRAFRFAFLKIMKKKLPNDALGPMLSAHKKLIVEKLAEEEEEHKVKGEAKKEKLASGAYRTPFIAIQ